MPYLDTRIKRVASQYIHHMEDSNLSLEYINEARRILCAFRGFLEGEGIFGISRVRSGHLKDFLSRLDGYSASYQRYNFSVLRGFLLFGNNAHALKYRLRVSGTSRERVDWLSSEETEQVLATPMTAREGMLIRGGLLQGLRRIEIVRMTAKDATSALLSRVLTVHGKGGKTRSIPIHPGFVQALEAYLRDSLHEANMPLLGIGKTRAAAVVVEFSLRFGRRFSTHTLRRTFGRNLWLKGVDVLTISELMGHSSVDVTRRYLGINITDMRKAISEYEIKSELVIIEDVPQRRIAPPRQPEPESVSLQA